MGGFTVSLMGSIFFALLPLKSVDRLSFFGTKFRVWLIAWFSVGHPILIVLAVYFFLFGQTLADGSVLNGPLGRALPRRLWWFVYHDDNLFVAHFQDDRRKLKFSTECFW